MKKILTIALMALFAISAHAQNHWTYNPHLYANTMTMVGVVHINDAEIPRESMEVGAFCGDECRGSETLHHHPNADRCFVYLSVSGNNGDVIQFRLYDAQTEVELMATAPTETFVANAMLGRAGDPYVLDFSTTVDEVPIVAETNEVGATGAGGTVEGSGSYLYGEECTLTAVPDAGCFFENWTEETEDRATVVVSTDPVYTFVVTGKRSLTANFTTVPPEGGASNQFVKLYPGWNWFTSYLTFDNNLENVLKNAIAAKNYTALIKDMSQNISLENGVWSTGNLSIGNESMYMILVEDTVSLLLTSPLANPADHPITLYPGWNWVGFISPLPMKVDDALSSISPSEGDVLKSNAFNTTYSTQNGWNGSLDSLKPGVGYMYLNNGTASQTLTYPAVFSHTIEGHVEIPEGMDASNIVVTNFSEEVVPDENGEFEIGYSNLMMASNADNGELIYFSVLSVDDHSSDGKGVADTIDLNAKETALFITLRCIPFGLGKGPQANYEALKDVLYSLQCVKDLESAIHDVVQTYGYLKTDELVDVINAVKDFLYSELGFVGRTRNGLAESVVQVQGRGEPRDLQSPYLPNDRALGIYISIDESSHSENPEQWTINCTGRNGLPSTFGVVKGYVQAMGGENEFSTTFQYSDSDNMYFLPPVGLSDILDVVVLWDGVKEAFQALRDKMQQGEASYHADFYKTKTENMLFEMPEPPLGDYNALCVVAPMDNTEVFMINCLFAFMDLLEFAIPPSELDPLIKGFLNDAEYVSMFISQIGNWPEGEQIIIQETATKFFELSRDCLIEVGIRNIQDLYLALSGISVVTNTIDIIAEMTTSLYVQSFALQVQTEYPEPTPELPVVVTDTCVVDGLTATVYGSLNSIGSYSISERGVCYGTTDNPTINNGGKVIAEGTDVGEFECVLQDLQPQTSYYARAYALNWLGMVGYGDVVNFATMSDGSGDLPEGALGGTFTINANGDQVRFSQGNLQYQASTNTWRFAENQWDYVGGQNPYNGNPGGTIDGSDNANISPTYTGWIDLFGWGTSGYNHGAVCYQPWGSSNNYSDYYVYGESNYNLFEQTGQADWGYNAIQNGGNSENIGWRSLTYEECLYLIRTRNTTSGIRYAKAVVNEVNGLILLPDNWCSDYYALNNVNTSEADYLSNTISATQWLILEEHGAVFLPAAGIRTNMGIMKPGDTGRYWSASYYNKFHAVFLGFCFSTDDSYVSLYSYLRSYGSSVRLVCSSESTEEYSIQVTVDPSEGGTVTGAGNYRNGVTCTLTASANTGYTFSHWTENGVTVCTDPEYSFVVTTDRNLVANFELVGSDTIEEGALPGVFTVNANGDQVRFSQGNLQYIGSAGNGDDNNTGAYWKFADHQWDYLGDNGQGSDSKTVDRDLFGWGTSGYNHGASCYQPWSTDGDYYAYGSDNYNLYDLTGQADWGFNAISNGGNQENSGWRTLTREELSYLFFTRSTMSGIRYAKAIVNGVNGVILLPDDWSMDYYTLTNTNTSSANFNSNTISVTSWTILEQHGAVFLPAAGYRLRTWVLLVGTNGNYWSASYISSSNAIELNFYDSQLETVGTSRVPGRSVRLVCPAD